MRVVVLEDDEHLREGILLPGLREFGFHAEGAASAGALYRLMVGQVFDLAALDIGLPDENGLSVASYLREVSPSMGMVMLTANSGRDDQIQALTRGADAFLRKPVDIEILALTLRNMARRLASNAGSPAPGVRRWQLESDSWCLVAPDGCITPLTASERSVMRTLDAHRGQAVPRATLIAALAEDVDQFDPHRLDMLIHRLRRKAEGLASSGDPLPLMSSRGVGYRLAE